MYKAPIKHLFTVFTLLVVSSAYADNHKKFYMGLTGGAVISSNFKSGGDDIDNIQNAPVYGAVAGYKVNEFFRFNIGLNRSGDRKAASNISGNKKLKASFNTNHFLASANYMVPVSQSIQPFLSAGIGLSRNKMDYYNVIQNNIILTSAGSSSNNSFMYSLGGGINFDYKDFLNDIEVKYVDSGKVKSGSSSGLDSNKIKLKDFVLTLSVSYKL